jgi:hypothetical protein
MAKQTSPQTIQPARDSYLKDAQGRLVPIELVKPEHLLEDDLVRALHAKAIVISEQLRLFRDESVAV